jgi:hypothetical protein
MPAQDEDASDKRHSQVARLLPEDWDRRPFAVATEIRQLLNTIKDADTTIDSASGSDTAYLWVTIDGIEYYISIRRSNLQLARQEKRNGNT